MKVLSGDNTEKIWTHQFLATSKTIAIGVGGGAVSPPGGPGRCLSEGVGVNPQTFFFSWKTC